jgi:hypothetical protein
MAARSTLTVTSGTTITSAWGNSVRNHLVPYTTSNDVSSEGQLAVNTSTDQLVVYSGSAAVEVGRYGAFSTWTPTWTNLLVGNGTVTARYWRSGPLVALSIRFDYGSSSSIGGSVSFSLPVTAASTSSDWNGVCNLTDTGSQTIKGVVRLGSTTTATIRYEALSGSFMQLAAVAAGAPFTWATGDAFDGTLIYEAAM